MSVELEVCYRIGNAPMQIFPYPHLYVRDVFPAHYYAELQRHLPSPEALTPIEQARGVKGYPERSVMMLGGELPAGLDAERQRFWKSLGAWLLGGRLARLILARFGPYIEQRFRNLPDADITDEALLVHDRTRYSLGPHTDAPFKVVSLLFYLPADAQFARHGTSIYVPKDSGLTCPGGPHYPFERFDRMATMPFLPNTLFGFFKTDNSFHGVEPVDEPDVHRYLLLYDLRLRRPAAAPAGA